MAGSGSKGKGAKGGTTRTSRSRHSTPGSVVSNAVSATITGTTALLELSVANLAIPTNVLYEDLLERHGSSTGLPDSRHLRTLIDDLKTLSDIAENRETTCDKAIRLLGAKRGIRQRYDRETESLNRDAEEKARLKRAADPEDGKESRSKRRKDVKLSKEDRPLAVGAHGVTKQDGSIPDRGSSPNGQTKVESGSSSPLSQLQSPVADANRSTNAVAQRPGSSSSSSSDGSRQPPPVASVPQYQTFGTNPLTFDDPTVYHIRDVIDGMSDQEKRAIYSVAVFPRSDLKELTAGTPPDRDFSNAKPSNQVAANTFATYLEPYMRAFGDDDLAFLKQRGDRGDIFTINARGARHYKDVWAEEDGQMSVDRDNARTAANQARGSLENMNDETAQTDSISLGPVAERILSLMRSERRPPVEDKEGENAPIEIPPSDNVDQTNGHTEDGEASATHFAESGRPEWKTPVAKVDYATMDERLKQELRYIGFLGPEDEPSFDGHWDDEIAERIRVLQSELRRVSVENGAKKALLFEKVKEHMAHQEFQTIQDDLDQQLVQAFLKRNRTMNKPSKNKKRPGGSTAPAAALGTGVGKPGIGDVARTLIDRRRRWMETLQGIFDDDFSKAKSMDDSLFTKEAMKEKMKAEEENWDDEADAVAS